MESKISETLQSILSSSVFAKTCIRGMSLPFTFRPEHFKFNSNQNWIVQVTPAGCISAKNTTFEREIFIDGSDNERY